MKPEDLLTFIELRGFIADWESLGLDVEYDLLALQFAIMAGPKGGKVIPGTGGLRKLRFSPPRWRTGKRGALRVCYVYFEEFAVVVLVYAYSKSQQEDLTPAEKKAVRTLIEREREALSRRTYH